MLLFDYYYNQIYIIIYINHVKNYKGKKKYIYIYIIIIKLLINKKYINRYINIQQFNNTTNTNNYIKLKNVYNYKNNHRKIKNKK